MGIPTEQWRCHGSKKKPVTSLPVASDLSHVLTSTHSLDDEQPQSTPVNYYYVKEHRPRSTTPVPTHADLNFQHQ